MFFRENYVGWRSRFSWINRDALKGYRHHAVPDVRRGSGLVWLKKREHRASAHPYRIMGAETSIMFAPCRLQESAENMAPRTHRVPDPCRLARSSRLLPMLLARGTALPQHPAKRAAAARDSGASRAIRLRAPMSVAVSERMMKTGRGRGPYATIK